MEYLYKVMHGLLPAPPFFLLRTLCLVNINLLLNLFNINGSKEMSKPQINI